MKKLNWDKELKKVQKRGLYNPKVRVFSIIAIALLTLGIGLTFSAFSYSSGDVQAFNSAVTKKVKVIITVTNGSGSINTTTNYKSSGTVEYSVTPNIGYILDEANTTCNYNSSTKKVIITPTSDVNCKLVFKKNYLKNTILASNILQTSVPDFAYSAPNSNLASNVSGMFKASDDLGESYYFRGDVTNNYLKFANLYWRIVRINGDGSIRLMYDGTKTHINGELSEDRIVGTSAFNSSSSNRKYVGYTYDNTYDSDGFVINGTDSDLKKYLKDWYQINIEDKGLDDYIVEEIFCNDTTTYSEESSGFTYYGAYGRNWKESGNSPTLTCPITDKNYGGKYKLKIGVISADELFMAGYSYYAGGYIKGSEKNYLGGINAGFFSMSPTSSQPYIMRANAYSTYSSFGIYCSPNTVLGVRPVINLKADTLITAGDGTQNNPYAIN